MKQFLCAEEGHTAVAIAAAREENQVKVQGRCTSCWWITMLNMFSTMMVRLELDSMAQSLLLYLLSGRVLAVCRALEHAWKCLKTYCYPTVLRQSLHQMHIYLS